MMTGLLSHHELSEDLQNRVMGTLNSDASSKDANGVYTVVMYKRSNNTNYMRSTLSNPDANGNYRTVKWEYYNEAGTGIVAAETKTWTVTYDADGNIVSKVVA
jgi:YD repeat-containing protein